MGYNQIPLAANNRGVTSFYTPFVLYEINKLPMGIRVESEALSSFVNELFADLIESYVFNFPEGLLVYSSSPGEHVTHVRDVLSRIPKTAFTLNTDKVVLGASEFKYVGHLISLRGLLSSPIW